MKEQKKHHTQSPAEPDLFSAAELAEHAMKAAAEEEQAAKAEQAAEQAAKSERPQKKARRAAQAAKEIEFTVNDTTTADAAVADNTTEDADNDRTSKDRTSNDRADKDAAAKGKASPLTHDGSNGAHPATAANGGTPKKKKKKKKKKGRDAESNKPKTFFDQIHDFINEDEDQPININVRGLLGGDGLPNFFRRNWLFISIIVIFTCCYVTCRYMMQSAVLEHDKLSEQLIDRRYKNLTLDCELLERTLSSHVEKSLKDSTIHTPTEQAFPLPVEEEEE